MSWTMNFAHVRLELAIGAFPSFDVGQFDVYGVVCGEWGGGRLQAGCGERTL